MRQIQRLLLGQLGIPVAKVVAIFFGFWSWKGELDAAAVGPAEEADHRHLASAALNRFKLSAHMFFPFRIIYIYTGMGKMYTKKLLLKQHFDQWLQFISVLLANACAQD